jgi:hypothetical protein
MLARLTSRSPYLALDVTRDLSAGKGRAAQTTVWPLSGYSRGAGDAPFPLAYAAICRAISVAMVALRRRR